MAFLPSIKLTQTPQMLTGMVDGQKYNFQNSSPGASLYLTQSTGTDFDENSAKIILERGKTETLAAIMGESLWAYCDYGTVDLTVWPVP